MRLASDVLVGGGRWCGGRSVEAAFTMASELGPTQLATLAQLIEMGYDASKAMEVIIKVGGSLNRCLSALLEAAEPESPPKRRRSASGGDSTGGRGAAPWGRSPMPNWPRRATGIKSRDVARAELNVKRKRRGGAQVPQVWP